MLGFKTIVQHGNAVTNASGNTDVGFDFEEISCLERSVRNFFNTTTKQ
jgi:hypothetical protein